MEQQQKSILIHTMLIGLLWFLRGRVRVLMQETGIQPPALGRVPGEGNGNPLQYSWPGKSYGQRSLADDSP